ncbi:MAG: hypothetical protein V2A76_16535, partial [Planctomycetota bacterium]
MRHLFLQRATSVLPGAAAGLLLKDVVLLAGRVSGHDLGALSFLLWPLLASGLLGLLSARFLTSRHRFLKEHLSSLVGLLLIPVLLLEPTGRTGLLELAARIHGPDVTRTHFLWGVALTALLLGGISSFLLGAALASSAAARGERFSWLAAAAGALIAPLLPVPEPRVAAGLLAPVGLVRPRAAGILVGLAALFLLPSRQAEWETPYLLDDPIRLASGADGPPPADSDCIDGRPWQMDAPPGWPYSGSPLIECARLVKRLAGDGPLVLLGAEAGRLEPSVVNQARPDEAHSAVMLLPSLFADPSVGLLRARLLLKDLADRLEPGQPLAACVDLQEVTFLDLAIVARMVQEALAEPVTLLHGTTCLFVAEQGGTDQRRVFDQAAGGDLMPLFTVSATRGFITSAAGTRCEHLLLGAGRSRLATRQPDRAAVTLHRLCRRADAPGFDFLKAELAIAILEDGARREDRILSYLRRADEPLANRLSRERAAARTRLRDELRLRLESAPFDADIHHRLGRILARGGQPIEGIDHLTRAIRLRPKQLDAAVELAHAYLLAEERGERRPTPTGPIDGCRYLFYAIPKLVRGLQDPHQKA